MPLAMNAAIRWVGDFVRGRSGPWPDKQAQLRIYIIATILIFGGLCIIIYDFRQPLWPLYPATIALHAFYAAAPAGLFYRSRAAYMYTYLYTLIGAASVASAASILPLASIFRAFADDPIYELNVVLICIFVGVIGLFGLGVWRLDQLYKKLVSWHTKLQGPAYGLVVVGGVFIIAWSISQAVDPTMFTDFMAANPTDQTLATAILEIAVLPMLAALLWAYTSLRSRAVRDAFELP